MPRRSSGRKRRSPPDDPRQTPLPLPIDPDDALTALIKRHSPKLRARLAARDRAHKAHCEVLLDLRPRLESAKDGRERKHYLVDRDGVRWRIWDMIPPGKRSTTARLIAVEPPHNWADERVFVREDGTRRHYTFKYREDHALETAFVEQQLTSAR